MSTPSKPSKPPTRFGYKWAVVCAVGFSALAAWPYLSSATDRVAKGQPVTLAAVQQDVRKEMQKGGQKGGPNKGGGGRMGGGAEMKAVLALGDGSALLGGKQGLMEWRDGKFVAIEDFDGLEVRGLALGKDGTVWAASKDGLWKRVGAEWERVRGGDYWGVSAGADGALLLAGKMGVLRSRDGAKWEPLKGDEMGGKEHGGKGREKKEEKED